MTVWDIRAILTVWDIGAMLTVSDIGAILTVSDIGAILTVSDIGAIELFPIQLCHCYLEVYTLYGGMAYIQHTDISFLC